MKDDPLSLFFEWYELAKSKLPETYNILTLSTSNINGKSSSRIVLLKEVDERGFVFYTNKNSRKAQEITQNPNAAMCFYWHELKKQVRVEGSVEQVADEEADEYFASRPRKHQIAAWASKQSQSCSEFELERRVAQYTTKFAIGKIPRPTFWGGYRLKPKCIEFWQVRKFRLHTRIRYSLSNNSWEQDWVKEKLFP